ncbi:hypothetical protein SLEP1_g50489 [Rubroshorea leprosula]|uniref:AAA+ ATPase domain-containing protein n=1 Tax=Rubroshorea leprosula TaxID=152421 RepID=A0AAV5M2K6_9ROSI|nr:hypothetical protein SLEP1_g50489 [Rubroshorea leprosula]
MAGTEVGIAVAGRVAEKMVDRILNLICIQTARVCRWKAKILNLKTKVEKLAVERGSVLQFMEAAERRGEEVVPNVKNWLTSTEKYIGEMKELVDEIDTAKMKCFAGVCPNLKARYQISKKVEEYLEDVTQLLEEALTSNFLVAYNIPPPQKTSTAPVKGFEDFGSRMSILDHIMEALKGSAVDKIGVHGMPGVGKTMLAKEVARRAEEAQLFDEIVIASVMKNPDLKRIQAEIADKLELQLHGETEFGRANQLKAYLKKKKKILVILDDIWTRLDLDELGIPYEETKNEASSKGEEQMQCKILFTSRFLNVLSCDVHTHQNFEVGRLQDDEAWELLKKTVGDEILKSDLRLTATEIAKECAGLPLAIQTLGKALKTKGSYEWRDALRQLKKPSPENFMGISANVYSAIELSYKHLEGEELKQTFLLCSLLKQNTSLEDLLKYGIGLGLFHNINTTGEARDRVLTLVSKLKSCSLLLDGSSNINFGLHDIVHGVAISIASRDHHVLSVIDDNIPREWSDREGMGDVEWISLQYPKIDELPSELECPKLTLFCLCSNDPSMRIPENFFQGMPKLRVLSFTKMKFSSFPSSVCLLKSLRTLCMNECVLENIVIIGELKSLEVLSLSGCDVEELPVEIGQLTQLKLLDLSDCIKLKVIPPHVLACLSKLEELHLGNSFNKWDTGEHGNQRNASLVELMDLHNLTTLDVGACDVQLIPEGLFSKRLERYKIFIGEVWNHWNSSFKSSKVLKLELITSIGYDHSIYMLLKKTEELHVEELKGVKNLVYELDAEGFQELKYLFVQNAPEIQHIINSMEGFPCCKAFPFLEVLFLRNLNSLVKICQGQLEAMSFSQLRIITIECCNQLKNLLPFSIARRLLQLEEIRVTDCRSILKIVEETEQRATHDIAEIDENLELAKLRSLKLQYLPKFIRLCHGNEETTESSSRATLFNNKIVFPNLEELQLSWINIGSLWGSRHLTKSCGIQSLTKLIVEGCDQFEHILSSSMAKCLVQLTYLAIRKCKRMREIIAAENAEDKEDLILFPKLNILNMVDLENLTRFCSGNYTIKFTTLKELLIRNCQELKGFVVDTSTNDKDGPQALFNEKVEFPNLEILRIFHLEKLRNIWHHQFQEDDLFADSFCKLKLLHIICCDKLRTIFPSYMVERLLKSVEKLEVFNCHSVEEIFEPGELNVRGEVDSQLRELLVWDLPRLKHLWTRWDAHGIFTFRNLKFVQAVRCLKLQYVFPTSVAVDLQQLEVLWLMDCGIEEVVALGEGNEVVSRFVFRSLSNLCLWDLWRLKYFYPRKHVLECPRLKKFRTCNSGVAKETNGESPGEYPVQLPLFSVQRVIPRLEKLSLTRNDIAMICNGQFSRDQLFCNVRVLHLLCYHDVSLVLPINFLESFCKLEKLNVVCSDFEKLFPSEGRADGQEKFVGTKLRIKILKLDGLCNLKQICNKDSAAVAGLFLQNLEILKVWKCRSLTSLSASTLAFHNLATLEIWQCQGITSLVSFSAAQSLVLLKTMSISECHLLTEIVGDEQDREDWPKTEGDGLEGVIVFSKLKVLKLLSLTKLTSFCSRNFTFKFPSLELLVVTKCPNLETFCRGVLKTPMLQRIQLPQANEDEGRPVVELNNTINQLYKEKVGYNES